MWLLSCLYSNRFCYQTSRLLTDPGERRAAAVIANKRMHADLRIHFIIARETTTDRDRERGRLNQHSDVVNRECWLRPTGARRPIALADRLAVIGEDLDHMRLAVL